LETRQPVIKAAPQASLNHVRAGVVLKQPKDYAGAVAALERAAALDSKDVEATKQLSHHGEQRVRVLH